MKLYFFYHNWLMFGHANIGSRYPLATFFFFGITDEWPKITHCKSHLQMGLTMLYAFKAVAAIASLVLNVFKRARKHSRRHYKKSKPTPNNG